MLTTRENAPGVLSEPAISDRNDSEEVVTYISESMTVTSADEEKLMLLNKNTELRRINKELMKLNQEWDQIYHTTSLGLQQKIRALQQEVLTLKQQTEKLSMKLEHEQNKREYYEQTLIQELKKNQHLQEYVRQLEGNRHHSREKRTSAGAEVFSSMPWEEFPDFQFPLQKNVKENSPRKHEAAGPKVQGSDSCKPRKCQHFPHFNSSSDPEKEVTDLKDQLEALKCQTEIYEADYRTEHKDRERIKAENEKLRKKEEEMRQQMALLQEQLKIFEDDFRKERSDKQLLQRLLKSKSHPKEPILVHRCNSHEKPPAPISSAHSISSPTPKRGTCNKHCDKHSPKTGEQTKHHQPPDAQAQAPPFSRDY
ncbi:TNFAIP3-interacting protein 3-like [Alligator mississippiensis]|uniref:TNFAIP3-interacting protein 3-like n=1 Tax=Alligator mississippiensis TaxID=8496 RepID=A0A151P7N2_ALLMI|nr:TNFAIP3-interacting protein 3-like [Alligator mississippiensis]